MGASLQPALQICKKSDLNLRSKTVILVDKANRKSDEKSGACIDLLFPGFRMRE